MDTHDTDNAVTCCAIAELMASAPDMLAVLQDLIECTCDDCAKWKRAHAAITKATGAA